MFLNFLKEVCSLVFISEVNSLKINLEVWNVP